MVHFYYKNITSVASYTVKWKNHSSANYTNNVTLSQSNGNSNYVQGSNNITTDFVVSDTNGPNTGKLDVLLTSPTSSNKYMSAGCIRLEYLSNAH